MTDNENHNHHMYEARERSRRTALYELLNNKKPKAKPKPEIDPRYYCTVLSDGEGARVAALMLENAKKRKRRKRR